jgi:hypothetical protein
MYSLSLLIREKLHPGTDRLLGTSPEAEQWRTVADRLTGPHGRVSGDHRGDVNRDWSQYAKRLEAALSPETRRQLATSPLEGVRGTGLRVGAVSGSDATEVCSCDGAYFHDQRAICYVANPGSRRENFTVLHELGHHLVMSDDDVLSELMWMGTGEWQRRNASVMRFREGVLIPDEAVVGVLAGRRPRAADVRALYDATAGSMEACAVRLAERMGCEGYVALLDRDRRHVPFASQSPQLEYAWRRGSPLPIEHPAWQAGIDGTYLGEGDVIWPSRYRKRFWLDAVGAGAIVNRGLCSGSVLARGWAQCSGRAGSDEVGASGVLRPLSPLWGTGVCDASL